MKCAKLRSSGFTLIAALMLLVLMSAMAIGLMMMVNSEQRVGSADLQNTMAYHGAEGAIEKMTSDLANTYKSIQSPKASDICNLSNNYPTNAPYGTLITFPAGGYSVAPASGCSINPPTSTFGQIQAPSPNQGLYAQIIPINLTATAQTPMGAEVTMTRTAEVALIPVFQFGVFSDSDMGFFNTPNLDFDGRIHTNGDLYLSVSQSGTLTFHDKITAYGNVIRSNFPNGLDDTTSHFDKNGNGYNSTGNVYAPQSPGGCDGSKPACGLMNMDEGSISGGGANGVIGGNPEVGSANSNWTTVSLGSGCAKSGDCNFGGMMIDGNYGASGGTGAKLLSLTFVPGSAQNNSTGVGPYPYEIIRRPPAGESVTSQIGQARLANEAQIRVLLADDPVELPGGASDPDNIRLANFSNAANSGNYTYGFPLATAGVPTTKLKGLTSQVIPTVPAGDQDTMYFATGSTGISTPTATPDWPYQPTPDTNITYTSPSPGAPVPLITAAANNYGAPGGTNPSAVISSPACSTTTGVCPATATTYPYYCDTSGTGCYMPYGLTPSTQKNGTNNAVASSWNLLDGYLRVDYVDSTGTSHGLTREWLQWGFARDLVPPTTPVGEAGQNDISPNAIILLQEPAARKGASDNFSSTATVDNVGVPGSCTKVLGKWKCVTPVPPEVVTDTKTNTPYFGNLNAAATGQSPSMFNWYPINFYDSREGEIRDVQLTNNSCAPAGVMNAVELDLGNLRQWLLGKGNYKLGNGPNVPSGTYNGYILYFSDRRGMIANPNGTLAGTAGTKTGDSGMEDNINDGNSTGTPDGKLESPTGSRKVSPEDVNQNGKLDNWGYANLGLGLGYSPATSAYVASKQINALDVNAAPDDAYIASRLPDCSVAQKNWVSGARHVLKLVDAGYDDTNGNSNVPTAPDGTGGFTVASENPVYVQGDYNTDKNDKTWSATAPTDQAHSAAGIIADSVTLLSDSWVDQGTLFNNGPTNPTGNRNASTTYYRMAIAGGKNMNFPFPAWGDVLNSGWGTDGGVSNFLRFLEDWSTPSATLHYEGSLVSMFYSTYATGAFKCCTYSVYEPPIRNYIFDSDFTVPTNLPPGTPTFQDVDNLSYRQLFTPQ